MNKRIEELALLCYEECGDYHIGSNSQFNHQKFAQLIVEECMNAIYDIDDLGGYHFKAANAIKKHFGVE